jgi:hypothetical protein
MRLAALVGIGALMAGVLVPLSLVTAAPAGADVFTQTFPTATAGVAYSAQVSYSDASGGPYTFTLGSGPLPPGLTLSPSGLLSGTPVEQVDWPVATSFDVDARDGSGVGTNGVVHASITVDPPGWTAPGPMQISTTSLPAATVGQKYSATIMATGGVAPYTWQLSGSLPQGFTLSNGTISGTTIDVGSFTFGVTVNDYYLPPTGGLGSNQTVNAYSGSASETYTLTVTSGTASLDATLANLEASVANVQGELGALLSNEVLATITNLSAALRSLLSNGCLTEELQYLLGHGLPPGGC